ncbi:MAG: HD domain-containing phosphohydrolase, partial [Anaerolineales bacterium]
LIFSNEQQLSHGKLILSTHADQEMRSACILPIVTERHIIGLIEMQSPLEDAYKEVDLEWMNLTANQIGLSIENARLNAETQQHLAELATLAVIDSAVLTHLEAQEIYEVILEQVIKRMGVDAALLSLFEPEAQRLTFVSQVGYHNPGLIGRYVNLGEGLAGRAAQTQQIYYCDLRLKDNQDLLLENFRQEGFVEYYGIALLTDRKIIGVLELLNRKTLTIDDNWRRFLEIIANQAAIALNTLQLNQNLQIAHQELLDAYDATIEGWARALDLREKETGDHTRRVADLTLNLAQCFPFTEEQLSQIRRGALLHDIGKLGIPDNILLKPDKLTDEEWQIMRLHPVLARQLLSEIKYLQSALDIPYSHHERWDGGGYPLGLKQEEIPLAARIFAVVDVYDALTSDRPYRKAWSKEQALDYIQSQAGKHFDPQVVRAFLEIIGTGRA